MSRAKTANATPPVVLIVGAEPLQAIECADQVRQHCRAQGFDERICLDVDGNYDWRALEQEAQSMSLFASRRLIELRLGKYKPGRDGSAAMLAYLDAIPPDTVLLITADKQDASAKRARWYKAMEKQALLVEVWPISRGELPAWLEQRAKQRKLQLQAGAATLIAERVEGNLLAAAQEIDKLCLLHPDQAIGPEQVVAAISNSSRFNVFDLVDTALAGDTVRTARIVNELMAEGLPPAILSWAWSREIRQQCQLAHQLASGQPPAVVLKKVWPPQRKGLVEQGLRRHGVKRWRALLRIANTTERIAKGSKPGNFWDTLLRLSMMVAGTQVVRGGLT